MTKVPDRSMNKSSVVVTSKKGFLKETLRCVKDVRSLQGINNVKAHEGLTSITKPKITAYFLQ